MDRELAECRRLVGQEGSSGWVRYSVATRAKVLAHARKRLAEGTTVHGVAGEIGLPSVTLSRWIRTGDLAEVFLPVEVAGEVARSPSAAATVVLHGPHGLRVEGADARFVAELILALA